jgi:hypothetical protein
VRTAFAALRFKNALPFVTVPPVAPASDIIIGKSIEGMRR